MSSINDFYLTLLKYNVHISLTSDYLNLIPCRRSGVGSRNGNNSNPNRGNNGNNVIGKFGGMDKNFGSGPVGSKLDQKGIIQDGRNIKGQKKNMNKDFLPSQVRRLVSMGR